jgi:tyrosyl-tRNA synthetase
MGGADQWGNITAGLELIRRRAGGEGSEDLAHALAYPLLLSPTGTKFGKSEGGESVWLDPSRTSPYAFYQYWFNTDDRDVATYLRWFTLKSRDEIEALEAGLEAAPESRGAQRMLAEDITTRVHGAAEAQRAIAASEAAFSGTPLIDGKVLQTLHDFADGFDFTDAQRQAGVVSFLVDAGVFGSLGEVRRLVAGGGLSVADIRISSPDDPVPEPIGGEWLPVRIGKRKLRVGRLVRS